MPNILFLSNNQLLKNDLINQIEQHVSEYKVYTQDDNNTVFEIAIIDGKEYLADFRNQHPKVPALILIANDSFEDNENKLDIFIFKPIILSMFFSQLKSGVNIFNHSEEGYLHFGDFELRPSEKELLYAKTNMSIKLTEREISIIKYLYKSKENFVSKNDLLRDVWEYNEDVTTHTIETHIYRLRKKVEENTNEQLIEADNGGYKLIF